MQKQHTILQKNQQYQQNQSNQRLAISSNAGGVASASKLSMASTIRSQMIRQNVRSITELQINALIAKQQLKVGQGGVVQVPADTMSAAQM